MSERTRIVIDKVRKDGVVFGSDYSDCDHSTDGFQKVMFRLNNTEAVRVGSCYSLSFETMDILKPFTEKSNSGKTTYSYPQRFLHKISNIVLVAKHPDADILLDL